ncbi:hypothetical protein TorRG33x02_294740, partial [Trema orientale]
MASSSSSEPSSSISQQQHHPLALIVPPTLPPLSLRLNRSNYAYWRSQILPAVRAHELE